MVSFTLAAAVMAAATLVQADVAFQTMTNMGCYSSSKGLTFNDTWTWQTSGYCQKQCVPINKAVLATTNAEDCWCGDQMPPASAKVDPSKCDVACAGWPSENCGDSTGKYFSVWNSGIKKTITNLGSSSDDDSSSSSTSSTASHTSTASPSVVTIGGQTQTITAAPSSETTKAAKSSGPNKAGIAAGVVVGVIAIAAIAGGAYLFIRQKKRREVEDEFKRQAAINSFMAGGGKPGSAGGMSATDSRLDPSIMTQRRMSDGSIADNQDYSRRILKVTNA